MPERQYSAGNGYRYGFNGKENDNEMKGTGNSVDFGARIYDPRIGRFLSRDPLLQKLPDLTPYNFVANNPISHVDPDGRILQFYGDAGAFRKTETLINNKFGGDIKVAIGADGIMTISGSTAKLNAQQLALYNTLNTVITSKITTNMYAVSQTERKKAMVGSFSGHRDKWGNLENIEEINGEQKNVQYYDVYDMEALDINKTDGLSGVSALGHEINEAYMHQDQGETAYLKAHKAATKVQGDIDGYTNVETIGTLGSNLLTVKFTTSDGRRHRSDITFTYGSNDITGESKTVDITPPQKLKKPLGFWVQDKKNLHNDRLKTQAGPNRSVQPMGAW